jgi:hypothetical protein
LGIDAFEWMAGADGVVSAAWLETLLRPQVSVDDQVSYGYQWYVATSAQPHP